MAGAALFPVSLKQIAWKFYQGNTGCENQQPYYQRWGEFVLDGR